MKNIVKKFLSDKKTVCISACTLFALILFVVIFNLLKPPVIAFYGIEESTKNSIIKTIDDWNNSINLKYKYKTLDSSKTLESQAYSVKNCTILFTVSGAAVKKASSLAHKKSYISKSPFSEMTSSIRSSAITNEENTRVIAMPLLSDHFEIDIDLGAFNRSKLRSIATWNDIEKFLSVESKITKNPLIFAGKDAPTALDLYGALVEAFDGTAEYLKAVEMIEKNKNESWNPPLLAETLCDDYNSPLYSTVDNLSKWYQKGLLNKESFNLTKNDVNEFLKARLASSVFMSLEQHRKVDNATIERFSSIYLPSQKSAGERNFTAKIIYAVPQKKNADFTKMIMYLLSTQGQEQLSRNTGLAPVLAHCKTPDRQSDDARYWIAATNTPLAGLSREVDLTLEQKQDLAKEIGAKIKVKALK